jgi:hypothetical protein
VATAPTFVASYQSVFNTTTSPKTVSVTTQAGDRVVVVAIAEDTTVTFSTPTGNSATYSLAQAVTTASNCAVSAWTATDATGGTNWTLSVTAVTAGSYYYGIIVYVFRGSDGFGNSGQAVSTGGPSLALTAAGDNSAIVGTSADWAAVDGTTRTWRTVNSITPTAGNGAEKLYFRDSARYTAYSAYWSDAGAAGSKTVGLSAPTGQTYALVAVEVKGAAGTSTSPPAPRRSHRGLILRPRRPRA